MPDNLRMELIEDQISELIFSNGLLEDPTTVVYYACLNTGYFMDKLEVQEVNYYKRFAEKCLKEV